MVQQAPCVVSAAELSRFKLGDRVGQDNHNEGYRRFRQAMQDGKLKAGMIVTQSELCDLLGLSLTPLRETLVLLEEFGLVEVKNRAGIRIVYPEVTFIRENFQFRSLIELHAIRVFTPVVPPGWVKEMNKLHKRFEDDLGAVESASDIYRAWTALDSEFHGAIVKALDNQAIQAVYLRIMDNINLARQVHDRTRARTRIHDSCQEHLAILRSVGAGDTEGACLALEQHFQASTYRTIVAA
jgi:GntR family transcriptional regulator, rspAB operon transcriptional repressor